MVYKPNSVVWKDEPDGDGDDDGCIHDDYTESSGPDSPDTDAG